MIRSALLAAAVAAMASSAGAATIVMNGDFETVDDRAGLTVGGSDGDALNSLSGSTGRASWDVYDTLPGGWANAPERGNGIEVQTNGTLRGVTAHSGSHYIELDSERGDGVGPNSNMSQAISLTAGTYDLRFWYMKRPGGSSAASNRIAVNIWDSLLDRNPLFDELLIHPSTLSGRVENGWTEIVHRFTVTEDYDNALLLFAARGRQDELGGLIDTVSISAVPLPAGVLLLLSGVAGMGAMRRRKKS
ncbi:VPLPA-CTERM sorting domain-containing protein [uncultured Roseobacter sp.]|uniref:VPLPA-CTERM sorting domain-containing protein n=1 Tax=uncultured Roseobacter sp. TaxID=114847 RepID=UPI00262C77D3|nr:VPLPA-CTERM sorting domain-containing protein [uncultured Roseobacter sp.]